MDVWGLTVAAFRRWYVLVPLLLISVTLAYLIGSRPQTEYEVSGAVILIVPAQEPGIANPYALSSASQILTIQATSSSTRAAFLERGLSADYEIGWESRTPVVELQVVAPSEQVALDTGEGMVDYLQTVLDQSQEELGIRETHRVTLKVLDAPDVVNFTESGRLRVTAMVGALGIVMSFAIAALVDATVTRRSSLTAAGATASSDPTASGM